MMKRLVSTLSFGLLSLFASAQISRLGENIQYSAQAEGTAGNGNVSPFWFSNNRYGTGSIEPNSGLLRANIIRDTESDNLENWRFGYGADIIGAVNHDSKFVLQQLYADFQFKAIRLSIGQKQRPLELKNQSLSSGALTSGDNARPLPQIRLELPDFWSIPKTGGWLSIKAHIAYGCYTDNGWQKNFTNGTKLYTANSLYHSKAGFLRIGNKEKFPIILSGGLEMSCQFGGEAWNLTDRADHSGSFSTHQKMNSGLKGFLHALIPGGNDVNDGDYSNAEGNQLGSWHARLDFEKKGWGASFYIEHFFEDHSQLFVQYDWKDMLYGAELKFPQNPFVTSFVYEFLRTTDQSGPIYHDETSTLPINIFGMDNYYNHHVYGGWQHAGFGIGNPLLISPIYNSDGSIRFYDNRITASHFGISGQPHKDVCYRLLFTHERSLGSYQHPSHNPRYGNFLLVETSYRPHQIEGLFFTAAYGQDGGELIGRSKGGMLTVGYNGWINKKKK